MHQQFDYSCRPVARELYSVSTSTFTSFIKHCKDKIKHINKPCTIKIFREGTFIEIQAIISGEDRSVR